MQFPRVHGPLGQGPLGAGSPVGDGRGMMRVLGAPGPWGVAGGEAGEVDRTGRGWTPGSWERVGSTLSRVPKVPRRVFPLTRLRGGVRGGVGTGLRGGAERSREGSRDPRGPCGEAPAPLPASRSPLLPRPLPSASAPCFCPHRLTPPRPLAGRFPGLPSHLSPLGTGEAAWTEPAHFSAPVPRPLALACFSSLSHILGTVQCPQTPVWRCLCPESRLFLSH